MALNLAAAMRERGHDAIAWSVEPLPRGARWWNLWLRQRRRIEEFLERSPAFDALDLPAVSVTRTLARRNVVIARSIAPDLHYLACSLASEVRRLPRSFDRVVSGALVGAAVTGAILNGWRRASLLLCLGTHELRWMRRWMPWVRQKLAHYVNAPGAEDQKAFAEIRARRRPPDPAALRFLWIGRWVAHKGTGRLRDFILERSAARPRDCFTIAGCGAEAAREFPPELAAEGRLCFVPGFSRAELHELLAAHDVGLFTSKVEGWGLSLQEMLESGMPVYATTVGAVADLRPFFPRSLRPFPPPLDLAPEPVETDPLDPRYYQRFTWAGIAQDYERQVLSRL